MRRAPTAENRLGPLDAIQRPALALAGTGSPEDVYGAALATIPDLTGSGAGAAPSRTAAQAHAPSGHPDDVVLEAVREGHMAAHKEESDKGVHS